MVTLSIFLVLLVLVLAFFLFFKLLKGVIKAIIAVLFLSLFVLAIVGVIIYLDVMKVKNSFNEEQTLLLSHKGNIVAGFSYDNSDEKMLQSSKLQLLDASNITAYNNELSSGEFNSGEGMTLILDSSEFYNTTIQLSNDISITMNEELLDGIFTCSKLSLCTSKFSNMSPLLQKQIANSFSNEQDLKNNLFFALFAEKSKETKGTFIISGIREDTVTIYPQLNTIRIVKMIPEKVINAALKKTIETSTEALESKLEG